MAGPDDELQSLQQKIDEARQADTRKTERSTPENLGGPMRFLVELASGIVVGGACGYFIDRAFGTFPAFFIICFFFGAAAGFRNLVREAKKEMDKNDTKGS